MNIAKALSDIERTLWTNYVELYRQTVLHDAVIIFPDVGRIGLEQALNALREENAAGRRWAKVDLQDARALALGPDVVLLHYAAVARWNYMKDTEKALCATLYVKREGAWRVAFHQQTAA